VNLRDALHPLDRARVRVYRAAMPVAGRWLAGRDARVIALALAGVASALAGTLFAPFLMLLWGPILLGVPHLVADLRYLVVRPGLHRRRLVVWAVGAPLALATVVPDLRVGLLASAGAILVARTSAVRRATAVALFAALLAASFRWRHASALALVHAHNAVAVGIWWSSRPRRTWRHVAFVTVAIAVFAALASGRLDAWVDTRPNGVPAAVDLLALARGLSPTNGPAAFHWLLAFVFAQSLHYVVWLRLIPEDDRPSPTPRSFTASARALASDLGPWPCAAAAALALALLGWAVLDVGAARDAYLRGALFHVHLEIAFLYLLVLERRPAAAPCSSAG
jgi:hypothetical protein